MSCPILAQMCMRKAGRDGDDARCGTLLRRGRMAGAMVGQATLTGCAVTLRL